MDQLKGYEKAFKCRAIERTMTRMEIPQEIGFDEIMESGEYDLDTMMTLMGR